MSTLFVVATPIGNLGDICQRAIATLKFVDYILCEDTRVSQKMLARFDIKKPLIAYHQHSQLAKVEHIIDLLKQDKNIALISDAGTPGISDPGGKLVEAIVKEFGAEVKIEPIPGPSAITLIASVCGFSMERFLFLGFPPQKNKRKQFFSEVLNSQYPVIFFESPHRILKTLNEISKYRNVEIARDEMSICRNIEGEISLVVGRELTKKFETIYRGTIEQVAKQIESDKMGDSIKGEFVIVVRKQ